MFIENIINICNTAGTEALYMQAQRRIAWFKGQLASFLSYPSLIEQSLCGPQIAGHVQPHGGRKTLKPCKAWHSWLLVSTITIHMVETAMGI